MLHIADVECSAHFYQLLGLSPGEVIRDLKGQAFWAKVGDSTATTMFAAARGPVDSDVQAVLVYLYSAHVAALRSHLLAHGLHEGGPFRSQPGPGNGRSVAFAISHQSDMPSGELHVHDPDGHVLLIGQLR